ncbi:tape measure protein [Brucella pituitosa]|uniref:Tape measure protein n=1 Tax=Brucella pituitosa TaxID=571256 RepID=A0ABS3K0F7_9HYPH|nr:tape measure protein [Brucella pituitosa]MBO1040405.1 tape measure protein [Brucella pituitosa]
MARTDLESLVIQLSADFKQLEKGLARAEGVSNRQFNAIVRNARQMNKKLDGIFANSFRGLSAPLAGIGAALGVDQLRKMTDTWTDMTSRVNLAAGSIDKGTEVMGRLGEMARRTYSDLSQTAESYLSNATALRELGYNTDESLNYTEALNNALVVSGAKGDRAARVIDALAKAMATGKLQGDNLNTVIESGGRVAEALAAGLDTTVGGLRNLGSQGKITGNDIVRGLSSQMETLRQEAADMPATIGDGFTLLNNALLQYVGNADSAAGVSAKISEALVMIADNFDKVANGALQVAAVIAGALVGRSLLGMIRTLGTTGVALGQFRQALAAASTMGGLATAFGGLGAAAGPVGMVIGGAVVSSLILYNSTVGESSQGATLFAERLKKVEEAAKSSGNAVEQAGRQNDAYTQNSLSKEVEASVVALDDAREAAVNMLASFAQVSSMSLITPEQYDELARLRDGVNEGTVSAEDAKQSLFAMANADYNFQEVADAIGPILDRLAMVSTAARGAAADLAAVSGARAVIEDRSTRSAKDLYIMQREAANEYERDQMRLAALSKKEHALEMERKKVRDAATKDGIALTEKQIDAIARANVAAQESRTAEGKKPKKEKKTPAEKFDTTVQDANDRTAALVAETEALRQINPLIDDYGFAAEKARTEQELLNAAQKAGIAITPELRSQIALTAQQWALATAEANKLNEAQGELRQKSEEWRSTELDAFKGLVTDLSSGKDAVEALTDAVQKLIDKLLDMTLNNLFEGLFGKSGSLFGGFMGFKDGGLPKFANGTPSRPGPGLIRGPGTGRSDSILARVSNKEFITNARSTAKYRGLLEAINEDRIPAFATGTPSLRAPTMPILSAPQRPSAAQAAPQININVASASGDDYIRAVVSDGVSNGLRQYDKSGPMRFARDSKQASRRGLVR